MFMLFNGYIDSISTIITQQHLLKINFPDIEFCKSVGWNGEKTFQYVKMIIKSIRAPIVHVDKNRTSLSELYNDYLVNMKDFISSEKLEEISLQIQSALYKGSKTVMIFFEAVTTIMVQLLVSQGNIDMRPFLKSDLENAGVQFGKDWAVTIGQWIRSEPFGKETPRKIKKITEDHTKKESRKERMFRVISEAMSALNGQ